jgi:UPF0716 protein FxsA
MRAIVPLFALLAIPILEIATFISVGQRIGVWNTIGLVLLATVIGVMVLRYQGMETLRKITRDLRGNTIAADGIADGFLVVLAAILLIIPGFLSDIVGLVLLLPPVRRLIWRRWAKNFQMRSFHSAGSRGRSKDDVVDLDPEDFHRSDDMPIRRPRIGRTSED